MQVTTVPGPYRPIDPVRQTGPKRQDFRQLLAARLSNDNVTSEDTPAVAVTRSVPQGNSFKGQFVDLFS